MAKRKKTKKIEHGLLVLLITLSIIVFGLMVSLIMLEDDKKTSQLKSQAVSKLMRSEPGVLGRSCGILSELEAKDILSSNDLIATYSNQPVNNNVVIEDNDKGIHWSDSCRYVSKSNSNVYVELFIDTYQNDEEASADLGESIPKAGQVETINDEEYDELYYSSGAWFAREGSVVIKVSANDGRSGDLKDYSLNVFNILTLQK